ncbi:outer membrane biogenesis protein BamB [Stieleria neptunia]|uniref:Outer membrane biogenesis protein BamB n=1 Tax=Stieleria neptunia TaxID=2527979 RepID=A0A518HTN6_9BACT|nr:PQQ-binding-like beta-propeller repeat protein [Stieleria neptunia]QDV44191.1 outer membrane biogenesis protein BamB [Stieleria neptunia]
MFKTSFSAVALLTVALGSTFVLNSTFALNSASAQTPTFPATDWPWWRGQQRDGSAAPDQNPPTRWSETENVAWKTALPGRGHGSPMLFGRHVYLATADDTRQVQVVLCLDRQSGALQWESVVHQGNYESKGKRKANEKASWASSTVATDGERLFINFFNDGAVHTTALDLAGTILWQQKLSDYVIHQGYGSSPAIYQDLVICSADNKGGGAIVAMDRATGEIVWRRDRPAKPNYASPSILNVSGKDQLVFTGCDLVTSLDPGTGATLWEIEGSTTECVTTTLTDGTHVFTSGGYPDNHVSAVLADGSGKVAWRTNTRTYVPSMLHKDGYLYMTLDAGIAECVDCATGQTVWKARLGGVFSSSPVLVGDRIYATNEQGETFVFKASPRRFEKVAENKLGESVFATPTICDSHIYTRVAHYEGDRRQEYLYCLGAQN